MNVFFSFDSFESHLQINEVKRYLCITIGHGSLFLIKCVLVTSLMSGNEIILYNLNDSFLWANFQNCNIV